ncbi:AAA family ATPase [Halosimplex pelagicum]|uniref:ORC1-type DNA replication protein n=1 Tax=Halosimplex pelagicum TaxID=869886 RepID=A0A7D5TES9_9EURY|nr:AAA family ATPase [Halosimplex pelagicum]
MLGDEGKASVFADPELVQSETCVDEGRIVGRDDQLESVVSCLKPALQGRNPANMLLHGPAGTGKSLLIRAVAQQIGKLCQLKGERFEIVSTNCRSINTLDQAVYELVRTAAEDCDTEIGVPEIGVSTRQKYRRLYELIENYYDTVIFVLDEIDLLVGQQANDGPAYSKILRELSRAGSTGEIEGHASVAALTRDPSFIENLDGRTESTFDPRDIPFPDYDDAQLREILEKRRDAFRRDALEDGIIPLIAALAAQSSGSARTAINLFRSGGDLADKWNEKTVTKNHVRESWETLDKEGSLKIIEELSIQKKASLYATASIACHSPCSRATAPSPIGFKLYQWVAGQLDVDQMTRETYVKYMKKMSSYGLVSSSRKSRGRGGGVYMEFSFSEDPKAIVDRIVDGSRIRSIAEQEQHLQKTISTLLDKFHE